MRCSGIAVIVRFASLLFSSRWPVSSEVLSVNVWSLWPALIPFEKLEPVEYVYYVANPIVKFSLITSHGVSHGRFNNVPNNDKTEGAQNLQTAELGNWNTCSKPIANLSIWPCRDGCRDGERLIAARVECRFLTKATFPSFFATSWTMPLRSAIFQSVWPIFWQTVAKRFFLPYRLDL